MTGYKKRHNQKLAGAGVNRAVSLSKYKDDQNEGGDEYAED